PIPTGAHLGPQITTGVEHIHMGIHACSRAELDPVGASRPGHGDRLRAKAVLLCFYHGWHDQAKRQHATEEGHNERAHARQQNGSPHVYSLLSVTTVAVTAAA